MPAWISRRRSTLRRRRSVRRIVLGGVFEHALRGLAGWNAAASGSPPDRSPSSIRPMPAARRLTEPCTRTTAMTPNASVAAARNTSTPTHGRGAVARTRPISVSQITSIDQILKLTMRYMMKLPMPIQPARRRGHLGHVLVPDAGIEIRRDELDDAETSRSAATTGSSPRRGLRRRARGSCAAS